MPKTEPRFDAVSIGREVNRVRAMLGISVPTITRRLKMNRTYWYKKVAGKPAFELDELGKIAAEFQAPMGWPVLPWDQGLLIEKLIERDKA